MNKFFIHDINIPQIRSACNFWMMRTNGGAFYREFLENKFIAIGWNAIRIDMIDRENDALKNIIANNYSKERQPGTPVNKCLRFIYGLCNDDIVAIVGEGEVTFALIGEYFEKLDASTTVNKEIEATQKIGEDQHRNDTIECPYIKRRTIQIIGSRAISELNPHLYKALVVNRHSLSSLNCYAEYILSECYDIYNYCNTLTMTFRVQARDKLGSLDISGFIFYATQLLCLDEDKFISARMNLSSPGEILFQIENGLQFIEAHWKVLLGLAAILFGGSIESPSLKAKIPSLKNFVIDLIDSKRTREMKNLDLYEKREKVRGMELDNESKELDNISKELDNRRKEIELERIVENLIDSSQKLKISPIDDKIIPHDALLPYKDNDKQK